MARSISCRSIFVALLLSLVYAGNCCAEDSITIDDPDQNEQFADGATIKPSGSSTLLFGTGYITVKIVNNWYRNGQSHSATFEVDDIVPGEFGAWEYPDDVTLHGPGYWSVTAFFTAEPNVVDVNYGSVLGPPP